jgi:hypothetical protein
VRRRDATLLRIIATALCDPAREDDTRALLRDRFRPAPVRGFKELLAAAPLEGIDLARDQARG